MKDNVIYHNPRCSKSRATLNLLRESGADVGIVEYLKTPPTAAELDEICTKLGIEPTALIRSKEKLFSELGLSLRDQRSRDEWLNIMVKHPKLIERPIVLIGGKAVVGRPPKNVFDIL